MQTEIDASGAIGRRYRRQDEIGTPWAVTVDHQSLEDDTVTVRDRDSLEQQRVPIAQLADELESRLRAPWSDAQAQWVICSGAEAPATVRASAAVRAITV